MSGPSLHFPTNWISLDNRLPQASSTLVRMHMSRPRIDKNVPIPKRFPFELMEVGDSFALPAGVKRPAASVAAMRYGRKHGMRFTVRQMPDKSFRCWRVA